MRMLETYAASPPIKIISDLILGRNRGALGYVVFRPRSDLLLSAELRRLRTFPVYSSSSMTNQLNLAMGILFSVLYSAAAISVLVVAGICAQTQSPLRAHVDLTRNGHRVKDSSEVVIWLTPVGVAAQKPKQDPTNIPKLVQKDKSFHPPLVVIPVGGRWSFPNHDPFFHNVFSLFEGKRF